MSHQKATSEQANILDWKSHEGKKETFFEIEKAGRVLKVGVHLKPKEEGNILWYLSTRTHKGKWSRLYLKLGEMEELGFLLLLLSRFCVKKRYLDEENFAQIRNFKQVWDNLRQYAKK